MEKPEHITESIKPMKGILICDACGKSKEFPTNPTTVSIHRDAIEKSKQKFYSEHKDCK